ncbi:hypothetical protein [Bacillus badius]|uniref:Uncharacterized protein n=1 Tax=Bacillus badius TaxID=1455 RepID=A0ABR5AXS4_BACBA|nr:hypothetical protein [Bacillus badius]KIL79549.1 hypothetical protein SD77_2003 [Bacillus badius]MED4718634.1 hypothetical protein [Bacillus badius]
MEINIEDSQVSLLLEIDGEVHLVGMDKEKLEAITLLVKRSIELVVPTGKSQKELREFLNYKG